MSPALSKEIPQWVVSHLGRNVRLLKEHEGYQAGHVGKLVMIDSGFRPDARASWSKPSTPFAVVALDHNDDSDYSNVNFEDLSRISV